MHWDTSQSGTQRHFGRSCTTAGGEMIASVVGWVKHRRKALPSYLIDWRARFNCSYSPRHTVLFWIHQRLTAFTWTGINVPFLCWRDGDDLLLASIFFFICFLSFVVRYSSTARFNQNVGFPVLNFWIAKPDELYQINLRWCVVYLIGVSFGFIYVYPHIWIQGQTTMPFF